jgi:hypothetical protein
LILPSGRRATPLRIFSEWLIQQSAAEDAQG